MALSLSTFSGTVQSGSIRYNANNGNAVLNFRVFIPYGKVANTDNWKPSDNYDVAIWGKLADSLKDKILENGKVVIHGYKTEGSTIWVSKDGTKQGVTHKYNATNVEIFGDTVTDVPSPMSTSVSKEVDNLDNIPF